MSLNLKKASRTKSLSLSDDLPMRPTKPKIALTSADHLVATTKKIEDTAKILKYIDENIVGKGVAFLGPFGRRKATYADFLSSGRSLQFFEDYINKEVLPAFGDVACTSSVTGLQSQLYSNEARELIGTAVNASDDDQIIFCEANHSSLTDRLCHLVCYGNGNSNSWKIDSVEMRRKSPVLFVSTSEPTKNLTAWKNAGAQIVRISKTHEGFLDLVDLENKLSSYQDCKRLLIGLFSGASRLTGIFADDVASTILMHQYGALAIWDYSMAAPYAPVDMNPLLPGAPKDILFFSTSKFIGGVQGPGVIVIKKSLIPSMSSLEIVDTVGVVETIRAGLVIQLKESLGAQCIANKQEKLCRQILSHVRTIPEIVLLGPMQTTAKRIPILSFLVKHPRGSFLHHRFVVAVLNDIFGIQTTATSHIAESLGISKTVAVDYENILNNENDSEYEFLRPGYTNLLIPFFMSDAEVAFILEALKMVATEAWKLLPQYEFKEQTGEWRHHSNSLIKERKWLGAIRYTDGRMLFNDRRISGPGAFPQNYSDCLQTARNLFNRARKMAQKSTTLQHELKLVNISAELLRWFMLPGEAHQLLVGHSQNVKNMVPFDPNRSKELPSLFNMFRHNSLSALDVKRFKSRSLPTSPVQVPMRRQQSSPTPPTSPKTVSLTDCTSPPIVRFSLGGEVTTMATFTPPRISSLVNCEEAASSRNRCHSWSSAGGIKSLSPQTRISLGLVKQSQLAAHRLQKMRKLCSCSSQTDIYRPVLAEHNSSSSSAPSLQSVFRAGSTCSDCTEDIQAYVAEVTKELATEIKSELREVISKVEDVLENTDTVDMSSINMFSMSNNTSGDDTRSDSVSATDVAEYLKGFSREMASEVKSEIRGAVNSIPVENSSLNRKSSPPVLFLDKVFEKEGSVKQRYSDIENGKDNSIDDSDKHQSESLPRPHSTPGWHLPTAPSPESSTPSCPYTGAISKLIDSNSTASQDSGINMCFADQEDTRTRTISENLNERPKTIRSQSDGTNTENKAINQPCKSHSNRIAVLNHSDCDSRIAKEKRISTRTSTPISNVAINPSEFTSFSRRRQQSESEPDRHLHRWQHLPKDVWKQTAEAIDEFDMLKDGDRILVCLSGSSSSLCLLHALRQFSRARGIHIEIAAITVGKSGIDPRALMLYMRDISIELYIEELNSSDNYRTKICTVARRKNYNVLAMGNTLDKLADDFLVSVLSKGKLHTPQAHCTNREGDLRIIRPFIYVRGRYLDDFAVQTNLPSRPSTTISRPLDASNSILKVQEIINPNVYENIKNALRPLLSLRLESNKTSYEYLKLSLISRD